MKRTSEDVRSTKAARQLKVWMVWPVPYYSGTSRLSRSDQQLFVLYNSERFEPRWVNVVVWVIVRVCNVVLRRTVVGVDWRFDNLSGSHHQMMMASAQVVETSVNTNNSPSQDYITNPDDHLKPQHCLCLCCYSYLTSFSKDHSLCCSWLYQSHLKIYNF